MIRVVDASVATKWFREEKGSDRAREYLFEIQERPEAFAVPELFFFEVHAVLLRLLEARDVEEALQGLLKLGVRRYPMDEGLSHCACEIVSKFKLTGYDAAYAALAKLLRGKWLTFDGEAVSRLQGANYALCLDS